MPRKWCGDVYRPEQKIPHGSGSIGYTQEFKVYFGDFGNLFFILI